MKSGIVTGRPGTKQEHHTLEVLLADVKNRNCIVYRDEREYVSTYGQRIVFKMETIVNHMASLITLSREHPESEFTIRSLNGETTYYKVVNGIPKKLAEEAEAV